MRGKIKELMAGFLGVKISDIEDEALLREDLGFGGSELTELLDALKEQTGAEVPAEELGEAETVGEFIDLVERYAQDEL